MNRSDLTVRLLAPLVLSACCAPAFAQTVEDQKAVLDAQIELLKKQIELQNTLKTLAGTGAQGMPAVVSVASFGGKRMVRLQLPGGQVSQFEEGDVVRPGMVLASVEPRKVIVLVENGKRQAQIPLEFASGGQPGPGMPRPDGSNQAAIPMVLLPEPPTIPLPAGYPMPSQARPASRSADARVAAPAGPAVAPAPGPQAVPVAAPPAGTPATSPAPRPADAAAVATRTAQAALPGAPSPRPTTAGPALAAGK